MPCPFCEAPLLGEPAVCPECGKPLGAAAPSTAAGHAHQVRSAAQVRPGAPGAVRPAAAGAVRPAAAGAVRPAAPAGRPAQPQPAAAGGDDLWGPLAAQQERPAAAVPATRPRREEVSTFVDADDPTPQLVERTFQRDVGDVEPEPVPGLIDSRLFGAFVPPNVQVDPMQEIEATLEEEIEVEVEPMPDLEEFAEDTSGQVANFATDEPVEGLIDARLFGAYMPDHVDIETLDGVEYEEFEGDAKLREWPDMEKVDPSAPPLAHCRGCGLTERVTLCPNCGARMEVLASEEG